MNPPSYARISCVHQSGGNSGLLELNNEPSTTNQRGEDVCITDNPVVSLNRTWPRTDDWIVAGLVVWSRGKQKAQSE
jgi:hypothetical protein